MQTLFSTSPARIKESRLCEHTQQMVNQVAVRMAVITLLHQCVQIPAVCMCALCGKLQAACLLQKNLASQTCNQTARGVSTVFMVGNACRRQVTLCHMTLRTESEMHKCALSYHECGVKRVWDCMQEGLLVKDGLVESLLLQTGTAD